MNLPARTALRGLLFSALVTVTAMAGAAAAAAPLDPPEPAAEAPGAGVAGAPHIISDPLYELLIDIAEGDSLGAWSQADLRARIERTGRRSKLPYELIEKIVRRPALPAEAETRRGAQVSRVWEITLTHAVRMPMPYSFLGYHPGSLLASRRFIASEWRLGPRTLYMARGNTVTRYEAEGTLVFRLDEGYIALDVDAWLDKLLGSLLDDFYTDGFAICRCWGRLWESSLLTTRDGRPDYGEFDLERNRIVEDTDRISLALGLLTRPWVAPRAGLPARSWPEFEEAP